VQISTADVNGNLYVWGYIPVVVAKWSAYSPLLFFFLTLLTLLISGLYLKENGTFNHFPVSAPAHSRPPATEVPGTFRVNGSNRRMRELQAAFETPPRVCSCPFFIISFNV